jgi:uncharacterized protein (TIGR02246 family)
MLAQSDLIREAIENANRRLETTYRTRDPGAVADLYTEDGQLFPTGAEPIVGRPGIAQFWRGVMDLGIVDARLETQEVDAQGHTAIEVGRYTLFGEGNHVLDRGKYIVIWKQSLGEWRLHRDIWNTSIPPRM